MIQKLGPKRHIFFVYFLGLLSLLFFAFYKLGIVVPSGKEQEKALWGELPIQDMLDASRIMEKAIEALRDCRAKRGIALDLTFDPNRTGLVGLEFSAITTSLGNLEAKRTTTNPDFAGLVVHLLTQAGAKRGDTVAIGASNSFPALIVASLAAAKAMDLRPLIICSLGASQWGANNPGFHGLDIQECLNKAGILNFKPIALSLGGDQDIGRDMSPEGRFLLTQRIKESGVFFLEEPDLERNVSARMRLYEESAAGKAIKAFINIGGSWANMGTDSEILRVEPGLADIQSLPGPEKRGVVFEMARRQIPVIHLLYIKGLCERYGLPWDPRPLPRPGEGDLYRLPGAKRGFLALAGAYFLILAVLFIFWRKPQFRGHIT